MFDLKKLMKSIDPMYTMLMLSRILHIDRNDFAILDSIVNIFFVYKCSLESTNHPIVKTLLDAFHSPFRNDIIFKIIPYVFYNLA